MRQRNVSEAVDDVGPVRRGGFVQLLWHTLESGEHHDGDEGDPTPSVSQDDTQHGEIWAQEINRACRETDALQDVVDDAHGRFEQPAPEQYHYDYRKHPGQQDP